ncbi:MAG: efflux RND transporter periplasmic adaptor subunit, partial [Fibrobacter sp.]|nr:efflux RND transporter periplasmic adaptor subunit [Fibrobacter sp.]
MNNTLKTIVTLACATLVIAGCDMKKKDQDKDKATTIEQIQAEKGKPARVVKSVNAKL